ncbi:MAG: hypothetical protein IKF16_05295, partial [Lachnospiraceae bacterium]|nr:hypothetical protein [Lachnospiraceae bacterium]
MKAFHSSVWVKTSFNGSFYRTGMTDQSIKLMSQQEQPTDAPAMLLRPADIPLPPDASIGFLLFCLFLRFPLYQALSGLIFVIDQAIVRLILL